MKTALIYAERCHVYWVVAVSLADAALEWILVLVNSVLGLGQASISNSKLVSTMMQAVESCLAYARDE